jgi:mRNA-degrading endonuclease RelE of RelBE toxin-antitoxin system
MYVLMFTQDGLADVKALPKNVKNSLKKELQQKVASEPYGCSIALAEPLKGWRSFHWRNYRIVFKVYDDAKAVAIAGVGARLPRSKSDIYRKLETLASEGKLAENILRLLRGSSSK